MVTLHYDTLSFEMPESYNELTGQQLVRIKQILGGNLAPEVQQLQLLMVAIDYKEKNFLKLPPDLLHRLLYLDDDSTQSSVDWMHDETGLTLQLLPCINGLYGPKGEFDNLRLKEFHVAEKCFFRFLQEQDFSAIDELVATLYRPGKPGYNHELDTDGDVRQPFNPNELPYYTNVVSKWPVAYKTAVLQFYANCRDFLKELYDDAFASGEPQQVDKEPDGMFGLIRSLSGEKWGTFEQVEEMLVHTAFKEIEASLEDLERQKEMMQQ